MTVQRPTVLVVEDAMRRDEAAYLVKPLNGTALLDALNTLVGSAGPR
jgi:hypothetical protein